MQNQKPLIQSKAATQNLLVIVLFFHDRIEVDI